MPVLLVDDESTNGTADVARCAAEKTGKADALIVIQSKLWRRGGQEIMGDAPGH